MRPSLLSYAAAATVLVIAAVTPIIRANRIDTTPAVKPRLYTWHDFREELLAWNQATLGGAYQRLGKRGPWDKAADQFLDRMAIYFTNGVVSGRIYGQPNAPKHAELFKLGQAAIDAGCTDPLVLYCHGAVLNDSGKPHDAREPVTRALRGLHESKYPSYRVVSAALRLKRLDTNPEIVQLIASILDEHRPLMLRGKLSDLERRLVLKQLWAELSGDHAAAVEIVKQLRQQADADPWVLDALEGELQIKLAWDRRGSVFADTVTEEGWKGFYEHLAKARECLTRAWKLAPQLPEPAADMITVLMGLGEEEAGETKMTWFERAEAAQFDYAPAYSKMYTALLPRWGGDHAQMYALGLRAVQTKRFDTTVPWQLFEAVEMIGTHSPDLTWDLIAKPGIYEALCYVTDQYAAAHAKTGGDAYYLSLRAGLAAQAEHYAEAKRLFDKLGERLDLSALRAVYSPDPPAMLGRTYLLAGAHAAKTKRAEAALEGEQNEEALALFRELRDDPELPERAKPYLDTKIVSTDLRVKWSRGDWVDLQPRGTLDNWRKLSGKWRIDDDGRLLGAPSENAMPTLGCREKFGQRFEFSGVMETSAPTGRAGFTLGRASRPRFYATFGRGYVTLSGSNYQKHIEVEALNKLVGPTEFFVVYDTGKVTANIGGQTVLKNHVLPPRTFAEKYSITVGLHVGGGDSAYFSQLKIRKLPGGARGPEANNDLPRAELPEVKDDAAAENANEP